MSKVLTMKREIQIGWAAALFEGEGTFTRRTSKKQGRIYYYPTMSVDTTCYEIICDFYYVVRCGHVYGPYRHSNLQHKPYWKWQLTDTKAIDKLAKKFKPFLSEDKLLRAKELGINVHLP